MAQSVRKCFVGAKTKEDLKECEQKRVASESGDGPTSRYAKKSKTSEARQLVKKIYDGARAYYMDAHGAAEPLPPQFPESVGPTPPLGTCCEEGGRCTPKQENWDSPSWKAVQFSLSEPHYYSYEIQSAGQKSAGQLDGSNSFTVFAYGDLDCDGTYSTFSMYGVVDDQFADGPAGAASLARVNELE
jgi:hypothetical protein